MSVDPLAEERSWLTPYNYVQNNPLNRIDLDGALDDPIFDESGNFLGTDSKGYTGNVVVMNKYVYNRLTDGGKNVLDHKVTEALVENTSVANNLSESDLSLEGISKILTHVTKRTEGVNFNRLEGGIINIQDTKVDFDTGTANENGATFGNASNPPLMGEAMEITNSDGTINVTTRTIGGRTSMNTVEYIQSTLGVHEYMGHGLKGIGGGRAESKAYKLQYQHKSTFNKLTEGQRYQIMKNANLIK